MAPEAELSEKAIARLRYRANRRRRSFTWSLLSTLVVAAIAAVILVRSPGWQRTQQAFFDPARFVEMIPSVGVGLWLNLRVWVIAGVLSLAIGLVLALGRSTRSSALFPLRAAIVVYVDIFRGVPVLLVLLLIGFGLPALRLPWLPTSAAFLGTASLVLAYSAYLAEIFRAGIDAVHPAQIYAARSLGLNHVQATRKIVVPQAVRNVVPAILNMVIALQKDSGLISILGAVDAIRVAQISTSGDYNFTPYVTAGFLFLVVSVPLTRAVDAYNAKRGWRQMRSGVGAIR